MNVPDQIAIAAEGLSKEYRIGQSRPYQRLVGAFRLSGLFNKKKPHRPASHYQTHRIWAIKDVSFEVNHGTILGVIGRNGAGKSTLLKLLARITEPTRGTALIKGRVGSLLEVGTGFHPELTGRENVFLNGTVLGMSKTEIRLKFDEIVDFSGVDTFIDTPVKRYSSGMQVRLAFAVAAHLEPEILLVDEVLAVGDIEFQRRCLGRIGEVSAQGRTVVFVSHNMQTVRSICDRGILLEHGQVGFDGPIDECIDQYMLSSGESTETEFDTRHLPRAEEVNRNNTFRFTLLKMVTPKNEAVFFVNEGMDIEIGFVVESKLKEVNIGWTVCTLDGSPLFNASNIDHYGPIQSLSPGQYKIRSKLYRHSLNPGIYNLTFTARCPSGDLDAITGVMTFRVDTREQQDPFWLESKRIAMTMPSEWSHPEPTP